MSAADKGKGTVRSADRLRPTSNGSHLTVSATSLAIVPAAPSVGPSSRRAAPESCPGRRQRLLRPHLAPPYRTMLPPSFDLSGRRALITGSSQGIGLALAHALAAAGADVVLNGRDATKLDAVVTAAAARGIALRPFAFDVTDEAAVQAAAAAVGPLDILINNAGIHRRGPLVDMALADWQAVLNTNLTAAFLVARAFVPTMIARGSGKIINICSIMSHLARPTTGNYAAAKGGLAMLTRAMTAEWAPHNIQINGIASGYIDTPLNAPLVNDPKFSDWVKSRTPSRRWGTTADLTGAAVFFASSASDYINGQVLTIDGGMLAVV